MSIIGESPRWQSELLDVYTLVRRGILSNWKDCCRRIQSPTPSLPDTHSKRHKKDKRDWEDPITRDLVRRLKLNPEIRSRFHVQSQMELIESDLDLEPNPKGYVDIAILFRVQVDEICLTLECKRLNVVRPNGRATLAREYVQAGMMRFVTNQYARNFSLGGMIGYVMDGDVATAHTSILEQIANAASTLLCDPAQTLILNHPDYFSTAHDRKPNRIELRHQLLSAN